MREKANDVYFQQNERGLDGGAVNKNASVPMSCLPNKQQRELCWLANEKRRKKQEKRAQEGEEMREQRTRGRRKKRREKKKAKKKKKKKKTPTST